MVIVRTIIALAAHHGWLIYQMDVHNAFLQGDLLEEVYMTIPLGFSRTTARQGEYPAYRYMSQRKYALELTAELGLAGSKPASTPLEVNQKLTTVEFDKAVAGAADNDYVLKDASVYQRLVGKLLYLTMTRPDISYVVQTLSQFMHAPKQSHLVAATRVVRYIRLLEAKKQETVARSSAKAEFRTMASAAAEIVWLTGLFCELGLKIKRPVSNTNSSQSYIP
uniref:Uncharacterized mitochondrial protein AtMg00810-like n=1 Tax=Nicotiana tabacum TaxID=4097 RepID=A0A1S3XHM9_TOBAC|nr:PREDICTED: uncharacterized mitochondrial protein AtMg00810-like [Nicotiana tabacum]